jgi:hypothetical protein
VARPGSDERLHGSSTGGAPERPRSCAPRTALGAGDRGRGWVLAGTPAQVGRTHGGTR